MCARFAVYNFGGPRVNPPGGGQLTTASPHLLCTTIFLVQLKSLAVLGVEGYVVLLDASTSHCQILSGSDTARGFVEAEEDKGNPLDNTFFKYMCGKTTRDR